MLACRLLVLFVVGLGGGCAAPLAYRFGDGSLRQARGGASGGGTGDAARDAVHRRWCAKHAQMGRWQMEVHRSEYVLRPMRIPGAVFRRGAVWGIASPYVHVRVSSSNGGKRGVWSGRDGPEHLHVGVLGSRPKLS